MLHQRIAKKLQTVFIHEEDKYKERYRITEDMDAITIRVQESESSSDFDCDE